MFSVMQNAFRQFVSSSIARVAIFMGLLTLGSKVIGFWRETFLASKFGASYVVDSYVLAYFIPNILFGAVFVAFNAAFMPLYSNCWAKDSSGNSSTIFANSVMKFLLILSLVGTFFGIVFADAIVDFFAPGLDFPVAVLTRFYVKITFLFMAFTSITSVIEGVLSYRRIFIPQIGLDYFQNIAFIIAIFLASITSERILIAGLGVGYIVRMFVLLWAANRNGFRLTREFTSIRTTYLQLAPLAFPVFVGNLSQQFSVFVNRRLASSLPTGSVSALYFANQANLIIITIGIAVLTTVIYPNLLKSAAEKKWVEFGRLCQRGFDMTIVIVVPCALGGLIFRREIISILYERGAFDSQATELTSIAFLCYSMGLIFFGANDFITKVFFAQGKMRIVMYASLVGVCSNVALNIVLARLIGFAGLALASSIAAIVTFLFMFAKLIESFKVWGLSFSFGIVRQATLSAMIAVLGGYFICFLIRRESSWSDNVSFFAAAFTSGALYVICLRFWGITRLLQDGAE